MRGRNVEIKKEQRDRERRERRESLLHIHIHRSNNNKIFLTNLCVNNKQYNVFIFKNRASTNDPHTRCAPCPSLPLPLLCSIVLSVVFPTPREEERVRVHAMQKMHRRHHPKKEDKKKTKKCSLRLVLAIAP